MFIQDTGRGMSAVQRQLMRLSVLMLALPFANSAQAISVVNGSFEQGLLGWAAYGDVSVQDSNFGIDATDGNNFAVLTTIDQAEPVVYGVPLSGTFALPDDELPALGLASTDLIAFIDALLSQYDYNIPSSLNPQTGSVVKQTVYAEAGQQISFDYNFMTNDYSASLLSHTDMAVVVINGLEAIAPLDDHLFQASNAQLNNNPNLLTWETGFQTFSYFAPTSGLYTIGIGVFDGSDASVMSALAVDNLNVTDVPEPVSIALMSAGLLGIAAVRRKRSDSRT